MKKTAKQSKNVEAAVPFTAAQQASLAQTPGAFNQDNPQPLPGLSQYGAPAPAAYNPFDVITQAIQVEMQKAMMGKDITGPGGAMDQSVARDRMRSRMENRTRWGNDEMYRNK